MPDLYNVIYLTIKDTRSLNGHGYAVTTSKNLASKIWSTAYDWEALITGQKNPKQVLMGMTIHRITASKEVANYLHRANHIISYYDIRMQTLAWENIVSSGESFKTDICKAAPTHSSIDNNDGRQETLTGYGTTQHTNSLLFQPNVNLCFISTKCKSMLRFIARVTMLRLRSFVSRIGFEFNTWLIILSSWEY